MFEDKEIIVTSVLFGDSGLEVGFFEVRDQAEKAGLTKSIVLERSQFATKIEEITDLLEELIDDGLMLIRNPAQTLDPRRRIASGSSSNKPQKEASVDEDGN